VQAATDASAQALIREVWEGDTIYMDDVCHCCTHPLPSLTYNCQPSTLMQHLLRRSIHVCVCLKQHPVQAATDASAQALIREVWEVVDTSYMDARHSGFHHEKWAKLRDAALSRTYRDQASVHRCGCRPDFGQLLLVWPRFFGFRALKLDRGQTLSRHVVH
jgi:hypothetical protein